MNYLFLVLVSGLLLVSFSNDSQAKVHYSEANASEQRVIREERRKRLREYEKAEAQKDVDRELKKKRSALWKKEQARLTQEYRKKRAERIAEIEAEKEKEAASRARQKEIGAQMDIEESEYKAALVNRRMEILYGKDDEPQKDAEELVEGEDEDQKPFWEKVLNFGK